MSQDDERQLLSELRESLLHLHKALIDWQGTEHQREHGETTRKALLDASLFDPRFAWLRPLSQLIVRIDGVLEEDAPGLALDIPVLASQARQITSAESAAGADAARYARVLQESTDAVVAHGEVMRVLKRVPARNSDATFAPGSDRVQ